MALAALYTEYAGPPNNPTCWAHNSNRALQKPFQIFSRRLAGAERGILLSQNSSYLGSPLPRIVKGPHCFLDRRNRWRVSIKLLDGGEIIEELNKQLRLMGQLAKRQGSTFHRELDD